MSGPNTTHRILPGQYLVSRNYGGTQEELLRPALSRQGTPRVGLLQKYGQNLGFEFLMTALFKHQINRRRLCFPSACNN
ncbi:hypothetical protein ASPCAL04664 [Aspergillus calidoustus]|uniref:Uncharacterized protein n=1 Tax=Aspergillus calidoustus TaxID=454130 RepID=A0A0U5FW33_ASPCI|nr:hypothetical protein ASPCAL04664 [Aspergillus calidoustus]